MVSFSLSPEQLSFYKEKGYILLDDIYTPAEIEECCTAYDEVFKAKQQEKQDLEAEWEGKWRKDQEKRVVLSIHDLQCHAAIFSKMLLNEKMVDAVSALIGTPNVLLHHTKAHIKPPGVGAEYPTHQDYHYFPFKNHSMVAVFIHLDDSTVENGGLCVFPGSHKMGPLENKSNHESFFWVDQEKFPLSKGVPVSAKKGQVLIFSYLLVHGSYPNTSDRNRRMLLFQLRGAEDEPTADIHLSPCQNMVIRGQNRKKGAETMKVKADGANGKH